MANFPEMTRDQQLAYAVHMRDLMLDHMEGEDLEGFKKWERLYCAWSNIVDGMIKEDEANDHIPE